MPKKVFWPAALVTMGLIIIAAQLNMLPPEFANLWPLILIVVGLGGLLTSDRDEWMVDHAKSTSAKRKVAAKSVAKKKTAKKPARKTARKK